jgi:hypothetical protein
MARDRGYSVSLVAAFGNPALGARARMIEAFFILAASLAASADRQLKIWA